MTWNDKDEVEVQIRLTGSLEQVGVFASSGRNYKPPDSWSGAIHLTLLLTLWSSQREPPEGLSG